MIYKLLFLILFALNFFGTVDYPQTLIFVVLIGIANISYLKKHVFINSFVYILIGIFLSFISALLFRDQAIIESLKATFNYFYLILFFYVLLKMKPSLKQCERILIYLGVIASCIYILQFLLLPYGVEILPISEREMAEEASARFRIVGSGIFSLCFFLGVNRFILSNDRRYLYFAVLALAPILLMSFRTMIAGVAVFVIIMVYRLVRGSIARMTKYIILALIVSIAILQVPVVSDKVDYMIDKQMSGIETLDNSDYIRVITLNYFVNDYPKSDMERILGSGMPFADSSFGTQIESLSESGIYWQDWGLIGLTWILGPFTVIAMVLCSIKAAILSKQREYMYISIWLIYMIVISVTTLEYCRNGNLLIQSLTLYMAYLITGRIRHRELLKEDR
ncbi:MAG: hypothetical protein SNI87_08580 [Rikenellaceae bacterium]